MAFAGCFHTFHLLPHNVADVATAKSGVHFWILYVASKFSFKMLSVLQFTGNQDVSFGPLFINKLKTGMAEYWILDYLLPNLFGLVSTKKHSLSFVKHIPSPAHLLLAYRQTECCWLERAGSSCSAHEG